MLKYVIVLCLYVSLSVVLCEYLNKREGEQCEWEGLSGKCVQETACLTTLDDDSPKHPVCGKSMEEKIICCTDCQFVNNTKNAILTPSGLFWKNGQKARDSCLQYLQELPYKCKGDDFFAGIMRELDEEKKCYGYSEWDTSSSDDSESRAEYPHSALLGFGEDLETVKWGIGGSIISDKYILTAALHFDSMLNPVKFVALGVEKISDGPAAWQVHMVKRFIPHPDFKPPTVYNDIALIETENTITFNKNILPACLHVEAADDKTAITTTCRDLESVNIADTIQTIKLDKFSEEECKIAYRPDDLLKDGINSDTQECYGSKSGSPDDFTVIVIYDTSACLSGEPVLSNQFSSCVYSIIGVASFSKGEATEPGVYTRLSPYIPWIESVVWP